MRSTRLASAIAFAVAVPFTAGFADTAVAAAAPTTYQMPATTAATVVQPVAEGLSPVQRKPKKVTVTVRCDKVKNGTPANGHSEEKIEGTGRAFNRKDAEKAAEQDVDNKMPQGYHKRHCRAIN